MKRLTILWVLLILLSFSVAGASFTENSKTYNATTYETSLEYFGLNVTYNSTQFTALTAYLWYAGTRYTATRTSAAGDEAIFSSSLDIPLQGNIAYQKETTLESQTTQNAQAAGSEANCIGQTFNFGFNYNSSLIKVNVTKVQVLAGDSGGANIKICESGANGYSPNTSICTSNNGYATSTVTYQNVTFVTQLELRYGRNYTIVHSYNPGIEYWNYSTSDTYTAGSRLLGTSCTTWSIETGDMWFIVYGNVTTGNITYELQLTNATGTYYENTSSSYQSVGETEWRSCSFNKYITVPYLNFSFKDETTGTTLNASEDLTDIDYWLGSGTVTKNHLNSNTSLFYSYPFCISPPWKTVTADVSFKYSKSGYPQRTFFYDSQTFTNTTTNKVLYLLGSSDGIYSSIQVVSPSGVPIEGVTVTIEREISGTYTIIEQGITDSAGSVTFWLNPNYDHRITAVKTGYVTEQVTIRPSQTLYTLRLSQTTGTAEYSSEIQGLYWHFLPGSGRISRGSHNFNATVYSYNSNLEGCKIEIVNQSNDAILDSQTTAATNTSYCYVNLDYTIVSGDRLFGRLAVDTTNSSGYVYVDTDWRWIAMDLNASSWTTVTSFFEEFKDLSEFGEGNEAEYSRFMFFFIAITILIGVFMFFSGIEFSSPGLTLFLLWALVFLASMGGFFTVDMGGDALDSHFEKFGLFWTMSLFVVGFAINQLRRYGE